MNVLKIELVMVDDKFENGPGCILGKLWKNDGLCFIEAHLQYPAQHVSTQQHFDKINKGLALILERINDHAIIFGNDDVVKGIEQNGDEEIDDKNKGILFHERDQNTIDTEKLHIVF
jgi:hypothetical protein